MRTIDRATLDANLIPVLMALADDQPLEPRHRDHDLSGVEENKFATFVLINLTIGIFSNRRWSANPHGISFFSGRAMNVTPANGGKVLHNKCATAAKADFWRLLSAKESMGDGRAVLLQER